MLVDIIPLFHVLQNLVEAGFLAFRLQLVVTALGTDLGCGGYENFQLGFRENGRSDVTSVHHNAFFLSHCLLLRYHFCAYEIECADGTDFRRHLHRPDSVLHIYTVEVRVRPSGRRIQAE